MGHTVIQVPVPAFESVARHLEYAPACPHITVLGPFVDRHDVDNDVVGRIRRVLAPVRPFGFKLTGIGWFGTFSYLTPEPAEEFARLTEGLAAEFPACPPYGGAFTEIVPHLSLGEDLPGGALDEVRRRLPLVTTADEVTLTWWSDGSFEVLTAFPLHSGND